MLSEYGIYLHILIDILLRVPGIIIAVTLHEYTKVRVCTALGDIRPKQDGRLTLNPLKQMEPIGFIFMCALGFGWGKPVRMAPNHYEPANRRRNTLIVYAVPIFVNLLIGALFAAGAMLMRIYAPVQPAPMVYMYLYLGVVGVAISNLTFAFFQFIPIYPLAGERVLALFLKPMAVVKMVQYQGILQVLLMIAMAGGWIGKMIHPLCRAILMGLQV